MELTERVKPMRVTDNETGREYILDFTRETVRFAEERGFVWDEIGSKPGTLIPLIWYTAFRRYEPRMAFNKAEKLLEDAGGVSPKMIARLKELYDQALSSLVAEDREGDEEQGKNAKVTVTLD